MENYKNFAPVILRIGLAVVFIWFGMSQLLNGLLWVSWVPSWAITALNMSPAIIVMINGAFEVVAGSMLALGIFVRLFAFLLTLHLLFIIFGVGFTAIGIRDFGLLCATLALFLWGPDMFAIPSAK